MSNKRKYIKVIPAIALMIAGMTSCKHDSFTVTPQISFSGDILPVFRASCAINSNCHLGANNTNKYTDLTDSVAYKTLTNKQLVLAGNPSASLLYVQVSNKIMPKAPYSPLTADKITLIYNWIEQGAKNN